MLARHRERLLQALHAGQRRLDDLDFLIHRSKWEREAAQ